MAMPSDISRSFRLYVTHVDGEGHFLKISGQLDQPSSLMVETLFETARENLEKGIGSVPPAAIHEGIICAAKYKDGTYYRAKIINTNSLSNGLVGVHFIDYGNKDIISLSTIRFLDSYDPMFLQLRGQATDYYLSRVMHPSGRWEEPLLLKLQSLLCYAEYSGTIDANTRSLPIISIQFKGNDLSTHLVANRFGIEIPIAKQEVLLMQLMSPENKGSNWQPSFPTESPSYPEHVPFLVNQNFPSNPASAMRLHQNVSLPFNGSMLSPPSISQIGQRLLVNKASSRTSVSLKAPIRQPQHTVPPFPVQMSTPPPALSQVVVNKPPSPKKSTTYKSRLLEVGTQHKVFVSFAEEGPELFAVQLVADAKKLQDMMDEINRRPHSSLAEPPMIGTVCLGRMSGDRIICRAIVMNLSGSQCKLFFVDFGDTEMVSYYDIFDIPEEFVKPNVFAMRFCLSGVKKLEKGPHLNEAFKQLVNGKVLTLRVVAPEGPPLIQYGELFLDTINVLDLLMANMKDKLQFKWMEMLPLGNRKSVLVSYVDNCIKFYAQLSDKIDELNAVMDAVKVHCESSSSPGELPVGAACCARFPEDANWYRARVLSTKGNKVVVSYVDYGNEQEVDISDLRTITPELIKLPSQAMKCALKGFENKPIESKTSNQLEMLALEKTLTAHIVGMLSSDTMLVTLVDESVSPPLDVARRMTQLSTPRSNIETKPTTPVRKEAPESFSSPESDDGKKKPFRREKSFKDERRPPWDGNDDFAQRGGSFRGRDNKDSFERSGPGRHSDKFARQDSRPERSDRRGAPKPWENNTPAATTAPADDEWEDSATTTTNNNYTSPPNRQNRDHNTRDTNRRKPRPDHQGPRSDHHGSWSDQHGSRSDHHGSRSDHHGGRSDQHGSRSDHQGSRSDHYGSRSDHHGSRSDHHGSRSDHHGSRSDHQGPKPGWKGKESGVGRRLHQAAEASSDDSQNSQKFSIQDRLKRDNKYNQQNNDWEENKDDRNRGRPERRENRGDRRDNWGDKKENYQKREYRDNNRERGDRVKSNFTPRDRAERSYGSDTDKKSDKSFHSQDNGDRAGRAPPYKSRSKFTQVQYKELTDPVPLETPFEEPTVEIGAQHEVSVTWIISPESFYTQILSLQPKFLEMMHSIPEMYKGVKSYTGMVPVGASVLARYPADGVLYRATVVSVQPFSKFIVCYVDFGNKQLVDAKDIWQLDRQLMELPKMAVHCSLLGVAPKDGEWKANPEIDLCFNAPRYQCVFQEFSEKQWNVYLWNNGVNVADTLVEKQLAVTSEHQSNVALKDEAIDLTIIVGQQILCKITHVKSFESFYVQLDLDKAALVETAIANFDASKLTPLAADSLTDGVHCTVRHDDKIHRAILEDTSDADNIRAVLPDYGFSITTTVANLMILPTELSVYYYQSLECGLNNYTSESNALMTENQLKERLQGNKFIIYINYVDGIRLISTLYDVESGKKVAIFEPDEGAYEEVVQLCTRAVFNYNFGLAYISHAENLNEFYLQKSTDSDRIAELLDELFKFYEEGTAEALTTFEPNSLCAALSTDGNWYRATILSAEDSQLKVQFCDYGNTETVPKENLKKLDPKFFEPCTLALVASLGLVALQDDALAKLIEWTTDKEVQVTLAFGTDGWLASLHLDGVDLAIKLVNEKLAVPQQAETEQTEPEPTAEEPATLPPGCTQVYISHIDTPGHFWLQMADTVDKIEEIQAELQANADTYPDIENRELGTVCVAKYLADDQWYRAEILDADSDITTVRFIDYGNTDVLDNQPGLIKQLPDTLKQTERYAVKASVNAVPGGTGEWSEPASECFTQLVGDLANPVDALIVLVDITTYVDIYVNGQNLTDKLVAEGYATKSEEPECGDMPSCFASHINSPSEFWIQLETATPDLQAMETAMVDAENFPELKDKEEGVICAAKYPEDGAWYRAQVIVDGSEGTEVLFMDYGNASIANELRSLPDELKAKPALSRKCALQKPRDIKSWSRKSEVKFNELAAEGATIFNVQFIASGDISIVELYLEGKSVTEELVGLCEPQPAPAAAPAPAPERPPPVGQASITDCKMCHVNSVEDFYVQLDDIFDKIVERLSGAAEFESVGELKVGSMCAAFWDEDQQWHRAKIMEFCDGGYHVFFVDFGNKAECVEFKQLPEELLAMEPTAKRCRLAGLDDVSDLKERAEIMCNCLLEHIAKDATFQIEFLDSTKEPALVRLFIDGKDLKTIYDAHKSEVLQPEVKDEKTVDAPESTETGEVNQDDENEIVTEKETVTSIPEDKPKDEIVEKPKDTETEVVLKDCVIEDKPKDSVSEIVSEEKSLDIKADDKPKSSESGDILKESKTTAKPSEEMTSKVEEIRHDTPGGVEVGDDKSELNTSQESGDILKDNETEAKPSEEMTSKCEEIKDDTPDKVEVGDDESELNTSQEAGDILKNSEVEAKPSEEMTSKVEEIKHDTSDGVEMEDDESELNTSQESGDILKDNETEAKPSEEMTSKGEEIKDDTPDKVEVGDDESELNTSQELNESMDSSSTVIENKSFEEKSDSFHDAESSKDDDTPTTPDKDQSLETLENSNDTVKTPERDDSKDSLNTDTGYTSEADKSPSNETSLSPVKDAASPKKESIEVKDPKIETVTKDDVQCEEKVVNTAVKSTE